MIKFNNVAAAVVVSANNKEIKLYPLFLKISPFLLSFRGRYYCSKAILRAKFADLHIVYIMYLFTASACDISR